MKIRTKNAKKYIYIFSEKGDINKLNKDTIEKENNSGNENNVRKKKDKGKESYKKRKISNNNSSKEKLKTAFTLGDSILKKLNGRLLSKR